MGFLPGLFGKKKPAPQEPAQHGVIVHFQYGSRDLERLFALEKRLEAAINAAGVGMFDGNEIAVDGSDGYLYMYGPDADALFAAVRPVLEACDFTRGASARLCYGPPGASEREITIA